MGRWSPLLGTLREPGTWSQIAKHSVGPHLGSIYIFSGGSGLWLGKASWVGCSPSSPPALFHARWPCSKLREPLHSRTLSQCSLPTPTSPVPAVSHCCDSPAICPSLLWAPCPHLPTPCLSLSVLRQGAMAGPGACGRLASFCGEAARGWLSACTAPLPSSFQTPSQGPPSPPQGALLFLLSPPVAQGHILRQVVKKPEGPNKV